MFKSILMTATAAIVATAVAMPASAGWTNGNSANGLVPNGWANGLVPNGWSNGRSSQGVHPNGHSTQGTSTGAAAFVIDGIELPTQAR